MRLSGVLYFFDMDKSIYKCATRGSTLERFVMENAGVDQDAVLAYLSDGRRLTNDNLRDLAGAPDNVCSFLLLIALIITYHNAQTIFVFNKYYLDYDTQEVLRELRIQPPLQAPVEGLSAYYLIVEATDLWQILYHLRLQFASLRLLQHISASLNHTMTRLLT